MNLNRRRFLSLLPAPLIVSAANIMPIKVLLPPKEPETIINFLDSGALLGDLTTTYYIRRIAQAFMLPDRMLRLPEYEYTAIRLVLVLVRGDYLYINDQCYEVMSIGESPNEPQPR